MWRQFFRKQSVRHGASHNVQHPCEKAENESTLLAFSRFYPMPSHCNWKILLPSRNQTGQRYFCFPTSKNRRDFNNVSDMAIQERWIFPQWWLQWKLFDFQAVAHPSDLDSFLQDALNIIGSVGTHAHKLPHTTWSSLEMVPVTWTCNYSLHVAPICSETICETWGESQCSAPVWKSRKWEHSSCIFALLPNAFALQLEDSVAFAESNRPEILLLSHQQKSTWFQQCLGHGHSRKMDLPPMVAAVKIVWFPSSSAPFWSGLVSAGCTEHYWLCRDSRPQTTPYNLKQFGDGACDLNLQLFFTCGANFFGNNLWDMGESQCSAPVWNAENESCAKYEFHAAQKLSWNIWPGLMMVLPRVFDQKLHVSSTAIPLAEKAETEHTGQRLPVGCGPYLGSQGAFSDWKLGIGVHPTPWYFCHIILLMEEIVHHLRQEMSFLKVFQDFKQGHISFISSIHCKSPAWSLPCSPYPLHSYKVSFTATPRAAFISVHLPF